MPVCVYLRSPRRSLWWLAQRLWFMNCFLTHASVNPLLWKHLLIGISWWPVVSVRIENPSSNCRREWKSNPFLISPKCHSRLRLFTRPLFPESLSSTAALCEPAFPFVSFCFASSPLSLSPSLFSGSLSSPLSPFPPHSFPPQFK